MSKDSSTYTLQKCVRRGINIIAGRGGSTMLVPCLLIQSTFIPPGSAPLATAAPAAAPPAVTPVVGGGRHAHSRYPQTTLRFAKGTGTRYAAARQSRTVQVRRKRRRAAKGDHSVAMVFAGAGDAAYRAQKYTGAAQYYQGAAEVEPRVAAHYYHLGLAQGRLHHYQNAVQSYKQAISLDPRYGDAYYRLGEMHDYQQHYDEVLMAIQQAVRLDPDNVAYLSALGHAFTCVDQWDKSAEAIRRAIALAPDYSDLRLRLGIDLIHQGRLEEAEKALEIARRLDPRNPLIYALLSLTHTGTGEFERALDFADAALYLDPRCIAALYYRAYTHLCLGHAQEAAQDARRCLEVGTWKSHSSEYAALVLYFAYRLLNKPDEAQAVIEEAPTHLGDFFQGLEVGPRQRRITVQTYKAIWRYLRREISASELLNDSPQRHESSMVVGFDLELSGHLPEALAHYEAARREGRHKSGACGLAIAGIRRLWSIRHKPVSYPNRADTRGVQASFSRRLLGGNLYSHDRQ